jgi:hypothetical protein
MASQSFQSAQTKERPVDVCMEEDSPESSSKDFGSNEKRAAALPPGDPEAASKEEHLKSASKDLGEVTKLDGGFYASAGALADAMVPDVGDKAKLQLNVNVPVEQTGTVKAAFEFIGNLERDDKGVKLRLKVGIGVVASKEIDAWVATVEAFAEAKAFGYMEAYGDRGAELFRLIGLGLHERIAEVSSPLAAAIFDPESLEQTLKDMDEDDYVESGLGVSVASGVGVKDESDSGGVEASGEASTGTKLRKVNGSLEGAGVEQVSGSLSGSFDPFGLAGSLQGKWINGSFDELAADLAGTAAVDVDQLSTMVVGGRWVSGLVSTFAGLIDGGAGMVSGDPARQAGSLAKYVASNGALGVGVELGTKRALERLKGLNGVKVGCSVTASASWTRAKGFSMKLRLDRSSTIDFGDNPRATVYVLLENVQQIFQFSSEA